MATVQRSVDWQLDELEALENLQMDSFDRLRKIARDFPVRISYRPVPRCIEDACRE
jgi:hypothetical protein